MRDPPAGDQHGAALTHARWMSSDLSLPRVEAGETREAEGPAVMRLTYRMRPIVIQKYRGSVVPWSQERFAVTPGVRPPSPVERRLDVARRRGGSVD